MVKRNNLKYINYYIKDKIVNSNKYYDFLEEYSSEKILINIINIDGKLFASVNIEDFFSNYLKENSHISITFIPFILIPLKLNSFIKFNENENEKFYIFNSFQLDFKIFDNVFFFKNSFSTDFIEEEQSLFIVDSEAKIKYLFLKNEKKILLSELRKIKKLDVFSIFSIKKFLFFIEEKLKSYLLNKEIFLTFSSYTNQEVFDLTQENFKKIFSNDKNYLFTIKNDNIFLENPNN